MVASRPTTIPGVQRWSGVFKIMMVGMVGLAQSTQVKVFYFVVAHSFQGAPGVLDPGTNVAQVRCGKDCFGHGRCVEDGICLCDTGYTGDYCQIGLLSKESVCFEMHVSDTNILLF